MITDAPFEKLVSAVDFADREAAGRCLRRLAAASGREPAFTALFPHLIAALSNSANPDRALVNFERFVQSTGDGQELYAFLQGNPRTIEILVSLFAGSQFLTEILLNNPEYFRLLADLGRMAQTKTTADYHTEAIQFIAASQDDQEQLNSLRRFQRRELLRIGASDLLDLFDLPTVTRQLSNLADSLVRACLGLISRSIGDSGKGFTVLALGKLGGQELNYSSDIDLLFIGSGEHPSTTRRVGEKLIDALSKITADGFLYRVDMRLRPWGRVGALVPSLDGCLAYLSQNARLWEKQALLKARVIAGDEGLGNEFLRQAQPQIFNSPPETLRLEVFAMKQRTEDYLRQRDRQWGEVKLGVGSIRDIEFITQYLQLAEGKQHPEILTTNTLEALDRLLACKILSPTEYRVLFLGYIFLRTIEHHLQMMHHQQTNQLPRDPEALSLLARRLGFLGPQAGSNFILRYQQHGSAIRLVYLKHVGNGEEALPDQAQPAAKLSEIPDHLLRMHPVYAAAFTPEEILEHAEMVASLSEANQVAVHGVPLEGSQWRVTIVADDYPGELSMICGLLFAYNLNIQDGKVFTYESPSGPSYHAKIRDSRPKIVDVFTVKPLFGMLQPETWELYRKDLASLLDLIKSGKRREARLDLAKRVALALPEKASGTSALYPIDIEIDNAASGRYSVLKIEALDTPGFLYELTNALAFHKLNISRVIVGSTGSRIQDWLYVTDERGRKISAPEKLRELRSGIVLVKHFTHLLPHSSNPESALYHFEELIETLFTRPDWPDELASLERPEVLDALAQLLGVSDFLWDDFLRMQYANLFPVVRDIGELASAKTREHLSGELSETVATDPGEWRIAVNAFKDRELFRIDMRNILGYTLEFEAFSLELTELAEIVIDAAYQYCFAELTRQFGNPLGESGETSPLSICALGKCGGRELGYASDIELIFIYSGQGFTRGPKRITVSEFYEKLVENFLSALPARREGIFQIDLQLRPYGKAGGLAVPLEAFRRYYSPGGPAWAYERQALVKLRPVAGDKRLGDLISALRDEFVFHGEPFDVTAMRAMRERQIRHLVGGGAFNAKYSPGGLLDIEYLVQGLQITYGAADASLLSTNTREAMAALAAAGRLTDDLYTRLRKAHTFIRWLIDSLRVVRGNAKDLTVPPLGSDEFAFLARRLQYGKDLPSLQADLVRYPSDVQEIGKELFSKILRDLEPD